MEKEKIKEPLSSSIGQISGYSTGDIEGEDVKLPESTDDLFDGILEKFDLSLDECENARKCEEDDGFQVVGKKKKSVNQVEQKEGGESSGMSEVKVASGDKRSLNTKPKVPFHIPSIAKPQDEYKILVNNLNQPFDHVWLERSEDGSSFIHPAEKYSVKDFLDKRIIDIKPDRPPPVENSPYKLVEEVKDLKELAATLKSVNEFAVDLEHNQYRSFQGLTCLMQISTRSEDFVVDTLKLRIHIGPYLREVFKDPKKIKVMHGADRDIIWLQRDFGIYICNLFDTGQASKVLKLERNSLEYLLNYYCGITANKEYQNADWRLRPLPMEMIRYAREDTHYLLHIYDLMRVSLLCSTNERRLCDTSLLEVYERSYDICVQLYEKDVMTDSSFLYIYGLQDANLNAQQLAVVAGLCEWRDIVARAEDESTGYILPNKTLLDIARRMPLTASSLHQLVKSKHQYVSRNLDSVVSMIRHSIHNAPAYEAIAKQLKEEYYTGVENVVVDDGCEVLSAPEVPTRSKGRIRAALIGASYASSKNLFKHLSSRLDPINNVDGVPVNQSEGQFESDGRIRDAPDRDSGLPGLPKDSSSTSEQQLASRAEANIQVLKKSTHAFKALPGNSAAKRKFDPGKLDKEDVKIEQQIKSSTSLPLRSLSSIADELQHAVKERAKPLEILYHQEPDNLVASDSRLQNIILLNDSIGKEQVDKDHKLDQNISSNFASGFEMDDGDELMSLSDLSSSFKKCFQSTHQEGKAMQVRKFQEPIRPYKPFGYETARKQVGYEGRNNKEDGVNRSKRDAGSNNKKLASGHSDSAGQKAPDFFTSTGNCSATLL